MGKVEKLFFVDVETTNLPENDPEAEVIEIACGVLDLRTWETSGEWSTLVKHSRPLGDFTAKYFSRVDFSRALDPSNAIETLIMRWRACAGSWSGQNPIFDLGFLRPLAASCGYAWPGSPDVDYHRFDVASMMLPYVLRGEVESVSLSKTRVWAGCEDEQAHRAAGDVSDTIRVFRRIMGRV
jgi:hypothetical protein